MESKVFDLAAMDTSRDQEYEFQVRSIEGELVDFWVTVVGSDSDTYQTAFRSLQRRMAKKLKRNQSANVDPEEVESNALELLAAATRRWRGSVVIDGQPLPPCSPESVTKLCKRMRALREQIDLNVHERANFLARPAKP